MKQKIRNFPVTEESIRELATGKIFNRGKDYFKEGSVCNIYSIEDTIEAYVEGSDYHPYKVQIEFDQSGIKGEPFCSCPYAEDFNDVCKHIVAVLLTALKKPKTIEPREKLSNTLKNLNKSYLIQLIEAMLKTESSLDFFVEDFIQDRLKKTDKKSNSLKKKSKLNFKKYKTETIEIVHSLNGLSSYEAYWNVGSVVRSIQELIKKAHHFLKKGDGENAISILTGIAEGYIQGWTCLDGSDGETPDPFYDLDEGFAEALLVSEIPEDVKESLKNNIEEWIPDLNDYGVDDTFSVTLLALKEGWSDEGVMKALKGEAKTKTKNNKADKYDALFWRKPANLILNEIRLNILKREKRFDEYMNLALAEGLVTQYLIMKIERGNIKEAVSQGRKIIHSSQEAHEVSQKLKEAKALKEALEIGMLGLKFSNFEADFGDYMSELAEKTREKKLALKCIQKAFFKEPTLNRYNRTWKMADKSNAKKIKSDYIHFLKTSRGNSYVVPEEKIKIFLQEKLFEEAIKESRYIYSQTFLTKVMKEVLAYNPDWVIKESKKRAIEIIDSGKSKDYYTAVDWLRWTKKAYLQKKQSEKWNKNLETIKLKHKPKRKLMGLLNQSF